MQKISVTDHFPRSQTLDMEPKKVFLMKFENLGLEISYNKCINNFTTYKLFTYMVEIVIINTWSS